MIKDISFLTLEECQEVRRIIYDLKRFWNQTDTYEPAYTLGVATYRHAPPNPLPLYYAKARLFNPLLREHLGWLYDRLLMILAEELGQPTCYREDLALPGFHIFVAHEIWKVNVLQAHVDGQFKYHHWAPEAEVHFQRPLSFTLAISLPKAGGGLDMWDLNQEECVGISKLDRLNLLATKKVTYHPYTVGKIALHIGKIYHRIGNLESMETGDERITLQGHGLLCQGTWQLYW